MSPEIVVEYVYDDGSKARDTTPQTGRFWVYEQGLQASYYLIYDWRQGGTIEGFRRVEGRFQPLRANARGHFEIESMQCEWGLHHAEYWGYDVPWLRAFDGTGRLLPTGEETADELRRARQERQEGSHR